MAEFVFSGVGFFYHHFPPEVCTHYGYLGPVFKVLQVMTSHAILGVRTYNIAQRKVWVGRTLIVAYLVALGFEWFTEFNQRYPMQVNGNCVIGTPHPDRFLSAWTFYFVAMIFDTLTLSIATYYLLKAQKAAVSAASKLLKMLLYDGLGYFVALTAVNLANIVLFRQANHSIQASGVNIAYAITWTMSQRILIHAREARTEQAEVFASPPPSFNTASLRPPSQADKERIHAIGINDTRSLTTTLPDVSHNPPGPPSEFDIEVRIERSIVRDARPAYRESIGPDGYVHPFAQGYHV